VDYENDLTISFTQKYFIGIDPREPSSGLSALAVDVSDGDRFSFTHRTPTDRIFVTLFVTLIE
jgi:hypothetical protein